MTKRERVLRAIEFRGPDRVPFCGVPGVSDFFITPLAPAHDWQPDSDYYPNVFPGLDLLTGWRYEKGRLPLNLMSAGFKRQDEFGCVWETGAQVGLGEVVEHPLASWDNLETFRLPDPRAPGLYLGIAYLKIPRFHKWIYFSLDFRVPPAERPAPEPIQAP